MLSAQRKTILAACLILASACNAQIFRNQVRQDAYGAPWNGDRYRAPSADAVYDAIIAMGGSPLDPNLVAIAALEATAGQVLYWTAAGAVAVFDSAAYMRGLMSAADANNLRPDLALGWINVKDDPFLAKGDGVTNDTAAIQAAATAAQTSTGVVFFPAGQYYITDTIVVPYGVSLIGAHVGIKNRNTRVTYEREGASIVLDDNPTTRSAVISMTSSVAEGSRFFTVRDLDIVCTANVTDADVHGIEILATDGRIFDTAIERCRFCETTGYAIYVYGGSYAGSHMRISDIQFEGCAGAVAVKSSTSYYLWGLLIENCHAETHTYNTVGGVSRLPLDPVWDLKACAPLTMRNIITQGWKRPSGYLASVAHIYGGGYVEIDGWHDEWSGVNETHVEDPNYVFVIGRPDDPNAVANTQGVVEISRCALCAPIYVDTNDVIVRLSRITLLASIPLAQMVEKPATVENVSVEMDHIYFNSANSADGTYNGGYTPIDALVGQWADPNKVPHFGGLVRGGRSSNSIGVGITMDLATSAVLYDWDMSKGPLGVYSNRNVSVPALTDGTAYVATDADEGRVAYIRGDAGKMPLVYWTWNLPDDWGKCPLTFVIWYKPVVRVGAADGAYAQWVCPTGNASVRTNTHIWTVIHRTDAPAVTLSEDWQMAIARLEPGANTGTVGLRTSAHPTSGTIDYYIGRVMVLLGDEVPFATGSTAATTPIEWTAATYPTHANNAHIVGDKVWSSDPDAGEPEGWVCTTAGTPGTWTPFGVVGAVSAIASHDYGAAAVAWTMTADEAAATLFTVTNASGAANAVFPAAVAGKQFTVYNNSGFAITFKVSGQAGSAVATGKYAIFIHNATDCVEIYEQP